MRAEPARPLRDPVGQRAGGRREIEIDLRAAVPLLPDRFASIAMEDRPFGTGNGQRLPGRPSVGRAQDANRAGPFACQCQEYRSKRRGLERSRDLGVRGNPGQRSRGGRRECNGRQGCTVRDEREMAASIVAAEGKYWGEAAGGLDRIGF